MNFLTLMWWILAAQTIFVGISYMIDCHYAKEFPDNSYIRKYWRTGWALFLFVIDCGLVGFAKGIQPFIGA